VIEVHVRQVLHRLPLGVGANAAVDFVHRADRNRHVLATLHVPVLEEHMGHPVLAIVDDESLDLADVTVTGMDVRPATHGDLASHPRRGGTGRCHSGRWRGND
jgi:hypothetical protein